MEEDGAVAGTGSKTESIGCSLSKHQRPEKSWLALHWAGLDKKIFKPLLTHSYPTLMDTLPNNCLSIGRIFTSKEQFMKHPMMQEKDVVSSVDRGFAAFTAAPDNLPLEKESVWKDTLGNI